MRINKLKKYFVRQHDYSDCGVACLLSIARYYEGDFSLEQLRIWSGTDSGGTTILGITEAAEKMGLKAVAYEASVESLYNIHKPILLRVLIDEVLWHYIILYGIDENRALIGDPAKGIRYVKLQELKEIWQPCFCVKIELTKSFIKKKTIQKAKMKWVVALLKEDYPVLIISVVIGMAMAVLGMVMPVYTQQLIDRILPQQDTHRLFWGSFTVFLLLAARIFLSRLREMLLLHQRTGFNKRLIHSFFSALLLLPKDFFVNRKLGDMVARLNDAGQIQKIIGIVVGTSTIDSLLVLAAFGFIYSYSPIAMGLSLLVLPLFMSCVYVYYKDIIVKQKKVASSYAQIESHYISSIQGVSVIKSTQKEAFFTSLNQKVYGRYQKAIFLLSKLNIRLSFIIGLLSLLVLMLVLIQLCNEVLFSNLALGELAAVLSMLALIFPALARLALLPVSLNEAMVVFDRMYEYGTIQAEPTGSHSIKEAFDSLELRSLSFRFPGSKKLLKEVSFKISKGNCMAIIGRSGSGKTTLLELLQSFLSYDEGEIIVNESHHLKEICIGEWRNIYGVVPQRIEVFNGSLWYNVTLEEDKEASFRYFMLVSGFQDFIGGFPQSYHTIIGEGGHQLSGGELQVLGIMRALYRKPQLLLLDEFSAAMDEKTEAFVLDLFMKMKTDIAIIMVTHRKHLLSKIADQVYEMDNGVLTKVISHKITGKFFLK